MKIYLNPSGFQILRELRVCAILAFQGRVREDYVLVTWSPRLFCLDTPREPRPVRGLGGAARSVDLGRDT